MVKILDKGFSMYYICSVNGSQTPDSNSTARQLAELRSDKYQLQQPTSGIFLILRLEIRSQLPTEHKPQMCKTINNQKSKTEVSVSHWET